jgi:hypothetical protein
MTKLKTYKKNNKESIKALKQRVLLLEAENIRLTEELMLFKTNGTSCFMDDKKVLELIATNGRKIEKEPEEEDINLDNHISKNMNKLCPECKHLMIPIALHYKNPFIPVIICTNTYCKFYNIPRI